MKPRKKIINDTKRRIRKRKDAVNERKEIEKISEVIKEKFEI